MIKVENVEVWGWQAAIRGMRNPLESWGRSDSEYYPMLILGKNDLALMRKLFDAGTEHRKFMRMLHVQMDITAPLYWWKEMETYKVGTVVNSCSSMHKLGSKEFDLRDFSYENLSPEAMQVLNALTVFLNTAREGYLEAVEANDPKAAKQFWWDMIQSLPTSYNQKRTIDMNYEVAATIYRQRKGHKLYEWSDFIDTLLKELPYLPDIMGIDKEEKNGTAEGEKQDES